MFLVFFCLYFHSFLSSFLSLLSLFDSNPFNCTFLENFFKSIKWEQLDSITSRINCSEIIEIPKIPSAESGNSVEGTFNARKSPLINISIETPKTALRVSIQKKNVIPETQITIERKVTETDVESDVDLNQEKSNQTKRDLNLMAENKLTYESIEIQLYILSCILTLGLAIGAILFTRLLKQTQMLEKEREKYKEMEDNKRNEYYVKYSITPENFANNNTYDVIQFNKKINENNVNLTCNQARKL